MLTKAFLFPFKTIHNGEEIVDAVGETVLIANDESVNTEEIVKALNATANLELIMYPPK